MTVDVHVDPNDLAALERKLDTIARPALERVVQRSAPIAEKLAQAGAPRDTGGIAQSIHAQAHGLEMNVRSTHPGALVVEFGRHSTQMPPVGVLRAWAARHGIDESAVFPIARAIARRGIKGRFFMQRVRERLRDIEIPNLLKRAADEIEDAWRR
jgi:hypothetical protein